jgi:hypothetical protein
MNTTDPLITAYPTFAENNIRYHIIQHNLNCKKLIETASSINNNKDEIRYLNDLQKFINNSLLEITTRINNKTTMIERSKNFDIEKVKNLPDDIIGVIKSYLEPEITYTRKFSILRSIDSNFGYWTDVYNYLDKVPKKIIIELKKTCDIYPVIYVCSKEQKEKWCRMIIDETNRLFSKAKDDVRIDKLLECQSNQYSTPSVLDKWFKFFLCINTFKKHRKYLEGKVRKTDAKLSMLKIQNIVIK